MKNKKEIDMVIDLQDANILPLDVTKKQVRYLINRVNKLKQESETVLAKGKVERIFEHNFKGPLKDCPTECYIDNKSLEEIMPKYLENKNIILTARVVKE